MRQDLNKLLCERERIRSKDHYKNYRKLKKFNASVDEDDVGQRRQEGMKSRYGWNRKQFNENLNPLKGIIRKAVGRPWDKFYSELCETFDMNSVINQHILQHLYDYICVDGVKFDEDGEIWISDHRWGRLQLLQDSHVLYYVDPRDGIIKINKDRKTYRQRDQEYARRRTEELTKNDVWIDDKNILHQIDGVWYHYTLEPVPEGRTIYVKPAFKDVFKDRRGRDVTWDELQGWQKISQGQAKFDGQSVVDLYTGQSVYMDQGIVRTRDRNNVSFNHKFYHATKKTASHKTLKQAGLTK